jgi:ribose-phosphate pyrophosphokinase
MKVASKLRELKIFSGSAHPEFTRSICDNLGVGIATANLFRFSDGEIGVSVEESVRGADVYVVQPTCEPVNENLMELLIMIDVMRRASAYRVNVVTPYFGYARQDRKTKAREPITAKLVANLIEKAGTDRVLAADLHAGQIQGFFDIPVDHLTGIPLLAAYFRDALKKDLEQDRLVVISPDIGGVVRARRFAVHLNADLAIVDKRRSHEVANFSEVMAGTMAQAAEALLARGAKKVYACATHGVLSGPAIDRISRSPIHQVVLTNTIPLPEDKKIDKITVLSIAPLFAEAISRIHSDHSVSILFR